MNDDITLYNQLRFFISGWVRLIGLLIQAVVLIPLCSLWVGKNGNPERAVQWLAYCQNYEVANDIYVYTNHWSLIIDYQESLRVQLGDERFNALREEGKLLDEKTILNQLFEEFDVES